MMKTTGQDNRHTGGQLSDHGLQGRRVAYRGVVEAALVLLMTSSTGVLAQKAPSVPGTRVVITDEQLAEQGAPVIEALSGSPKATATAGKAVIQVSGKHFPADGHFPQSGFVGATFQMLVNGHDAQDNSKYAWSSSQPWASVDPMGVVTFKAMPTPETRTVNLTATQAAGGTPLSTTFSVSRWFINAKAEKMTGSAAAVWCQSQGKGFVLPEAAVMTATTDGTVSPRAASSALWNEWGPMAIYRSGWQLGNYWGNKVQGENREMVGLVNGSFHWVPGSSEYLVTCVRTL